MYISSPFLFVTEQYLLPAVDVPALSPAAFEGHPERSSTIFCVNIVFLSPGLPSRSAVAGSYGSCLFKFIKNKNLYFSERLHRFTSQQCRSDSLCVLIAVWWCRRCFLEPFWRAPRAAAPWRSVSMSLAAGGVERLSCAQSPPVCPLW